MWQDCQIKFPHTRPCYAKSSYRSVEPQTLHGNVHQVDHVPNGPTNSAAITTMFPLRLCGGKLLVTVTRERPLIVTSNPRRRRGQQWRIPGEQVTAIEISGRQASSYISSPVLPLPFSPCRSTVYFSHVPTCLGAPNILPSPLIFRVSSFLS